MPEDDIKLLFGRLEGRIDARMDGLAKTLDEIHGEVRATNGRVTTLEMDRARTQGANDALVEVSTKRTMSKRWVVTTLVALLAIFVAATGTLMTLILLH